jgi:anti-anti-sigma factor
MDLSTRIHDDWTICGVTGDVTIFTTYALREYLLDALNAPGHRILVDLSGVTSMDTNGLAVLIFIRRTALRLGGTLALFAPTQRIRRLLTSSGLSTAFPVIVDLPAPRQAAQVRDHLAEPVPDQRRPPGAPAKETVETTARRPAPGQDAAEIVAGRTAPA